MLCLLAMWGAWRHMDNLSTAKADLAGSAAALREPHLWVLALLYIVFARVALEFAVAMIKTAENTSVLRRQ